MALQEVKLAWSRTLRNVAARQLRFASTATATAPVQEDEDLEISSLHVPEPSQQVVTSYNPVESAKKRPRELISSRYKFRSPKYYRGPLHPHQPLPAEDIASREFVPGPFSMPRLLETYESHIVSDMLTLCYTHQVPGAPKREPVDRMRHWVGDSPYYENRPPKGPKGGREVLLPLHKPINFRNIPQLKKVHVHSHMAKAASKKDYLQAGSIALQSITGVRSTVLPAKKSIIDWENAKKGKLVSATVHLEGENMYHFLSTLVEIVLPRVKDWKGVSGGSGDSTGNISFGLDADSVALFPEIEVNYDMYPPDMIPGLHVTVETTAVTDREARVLLSAIGIPFHGKLKKR